MNEHNLHILFQNYIERFDSLSENYKWNAIEKVQNRWNLLSDNLAEMIKDAFSLNFNMINNRIVQPVSGLVAIAKVEPEKVRELFQILLKETDDADQKQEQILVFVDGCNTLLGKHFPDKWKYEQDVRAAIGYLGMIHPATNFLFKSSPAHFFAQYMDYQDDIGRGQSFKLKKYYRMCEELLSHIKNCPELLAVDAARPVNWKDPSGHVLTTDLIYCLGTYGLTVGMIKPLPKAKNSLERQRIEADNRQDELQKEIDELQRKAEELNAQIESLSSLSLTGLQVQTKAYGQGTIVQQRGNYIDVLVPAGTKQFSLPGGVAKGFVSFDKPEINERILMEADLLDQIAQVEKQQKKKVIEMRYL